MQKIREAELKQILKQYAERDISVEIKGVISTNIYINELTSIVTPDKIIIADEEGIVAPLEIEASMIYKILYSKKGKAIKLLLDNSQTIRLDLR